MIPSPGRLPLEGVRILELGHIIAGPAAGLILADLGADRPDELAADEQLLATDQLMDTPIGEFGEHKLPKLPFRSSSYGFGLRPPAPELGQHTSEILQELGYAQDEIAALTEDGSIS